MEDSMVVKAGTMTIDLDNINPPVTFYYGSGKAPVEIRSCPFDVISEIERQTKKKEVEYVLNTESRKMERIEYDAGEDDPELRAQRQERIWDYCIVSWKGFKTKDGKEVPCTTENKLKLMYRDPKFSAFVTECLAVLRKDHAVKAEAARKNA